VSEVGVAGLSGTVEDRQERDMSNVYVGRKREYRDELTRVAQPSSEKRTDQGPNCRNGYHDDTL
jgi:hypothetical protein